MASQNRSNADLTSKISKSIFVTNFPDSTTFSDLWKLCQTYGTVVDVYIPNRRSKAGKRFAFVRHTTNRAPKPAPTYASVAKGILSIPLSVAPALVLDDSRTVNHDLENYVMGEVKQFSSINNLPVLLSNEGFSNHVGVASWFKSLSDAQSDFLPHDRIVWVDIKGVLMHAWSRNTFHKIGSKWSEVLDIEESRDDFFTRKRVCIKTNQEDNILEKFKIILKGKIFVIRAKELFIWSPSFTEVAEKDYNSEDETKNEIGENHSAHVQQVNMEEESDGEVISDTVFGENVNEVDNADNFVHKETSYDPFKMRLNLITFLIWRLKTFGETPYLMFLSARRLVIPEVCYVFGILKLSIKGHHIISDNFIALYGTWNSSQTKMLLISVYAPQTVSLKRPLGSYLTFLINHWNGESILMGDFNEVRRKEDRWGTVFNVYGARVFNQFISSTWLVEIQLEGYNYTWAHLSASKISKLDRFLVSDGLLSTFPHLSAVCLDRHLSDHRHILLREVCIDYGATPFHLFHSWFEYQGFDAMVTNTWNSIILYDKNRTIRFKKKL
nr:RNA-directed DNA polymerase, eukaryota [Tanacetum cinerariifolium]